MYRVDEEMLKRLREDVDVNGEIKARLKQVDPASYRPSVIYQLIADVEENVWYCQQPTGESDMQDWEKQIIVAGLRKLLEG